MPNNRKAYDGCLIKNGKQFIEKRMNLIKEHRTVVPEYYGQRAQYFMRSIVKNKK